MNEHYDDIVNVVWILGKGDICQRNSSRPRQSHKKREEGLKSPSVNLFSPINMPSTTHQDLFPKEIKNLDGGDRHVSHKRNDKLTSAEQCGKP